MYVTVYMVESINLLLRLHLNMMKNILLFKSIKVSNEKHKNKINVLMASFPIITRHVHLLALYNASCYYNILRTAT